MNKSRFLRTLSGEACSPPPIWIMRQAGRYLPEYRQTRTRAGSFLDLCHNPELACEVTLQPIRRFDFDAAILFSDILVVPAALGQEVRFEEGRGPVLGPMPDELLGAFDGASFDRALERVIETVGLVRSRLAPEKALIGFCGAPWTVASYMIAGHGTPDQMPARRFGLEQPERFGRLLDRLVEASAAYLIRQIEAGADVVMIFDSWAGILDEAQFRAWSCDPIAEMVRRVREAKPEARVIAFARGAGARLGDFGRATSADALGVDWTLPMEKARELTGPNMVLQGNLDPLRLVLGGEALDSGIDAVLEAAHGHPHIFNLGHGVTPDTPVEHMARLVARVRGEGALMLYVKTAHIVSVIAWMAALLYLPRLMVYHAEAAPGSEVSETFKVMERRLLRGIATPSMIATWVFGIWMAVLLGAWQDGWLMAKLALVLGLSGYHGFCARQVRVFAADRNELSSRFFRIFNEVPALALVAIVYLVVVKPF